MHKVGDETHIDVDEARGGSTPGIVRWVLVFSLGLAIVAMSAAWMFSAWSRQPNTPQVSAVEHSLGGHVGG